MNGGGTAILIVEDDPNLGYLLQENFELRGFTVTLCADGQAGLEAFKRRIYDLCLIDVMMPKKDGFALARDIRTADDEVPLIFLTARSLKEDRIEGLRIGADDYVTKPFSMEELMLRVSAVLKRSARLVKSNGTTASLAIGSYVFDAARHTLAHAGKIQRLTPRETDVLRLLCRHKNAMLPRALALKEIWGDDTYYNSRSMDVYVSKLRKYLRHDKRVELMNVHGEGFKLIAPE